jgi:hypothetical protein
MPVLTLNKKDSLPLLVLTFEDAIAKFGKEMKDEHLQKAFRRAGNSVGDYCNNILWSLKISRTGYQLLIG